jgi:hypothetical protein
MKSVLDQLAELHEEERKAQEEKDNHRHAWRKQHENIPSKAARRLRGLAELGQVVDRNKHKPKPTEVVVKMHDETPMIYFDDGSMRRVFHKRMSREQKKALKRARQKR